MSWNKPPQKNNPLGKKKKKDDKKKKSLPPSLSQKGSLPSISKSKGLSSGSSEIRGLKLPSSPKGPAKKSREISSDQVPAVGAKKNRGTTPKKARELSSESSEIAALSLENPEEEVSPSMKFLNNFVKIFFIAFGCLYCLGLGFFFSANKRPPTSISDLVSVVTGLKRVFKSSTPSTNNLDELGDFGETGTSPDENLIKKARAKKEEGEDALIMGRRTSNQKQIKEAQKLFRESLTLLQKAMNLERDSRTLKKLEEEIVELQNLILDCGKLQNFGN